MEKRAILSRRTFIAGSAACVIAAGTTLMGCSSSEAKNDGQESSSSDEGQNGQDGKKLEQELGSTIDNPIDVEYGQAITCDDATLTIDSCDGFTDLFKGTNPTYSLSLDEGKLFFLVRATLDYQGKTEVYPDTAITAKFVFDGDFEFSATVEDTEKIMSSIQPLETRGITFCAQISQATAEKLSSPTMILCVGKSIESKSVDGGTFYRISL